MIPLRSGAAVACGLLLGATLLAQPPSFRSGVDLVTVDTLVVDDEGRPIVGLERDDFLVTVDGRPRALAGAQFIATAPPQAPTRLRPQDISTNDVDLAGRLVLVVVDRTNIRQGEGRQAMDGVARFVRQLSPADRVGLYTLPAGGPATPLSADRTAILAALPRIRGVELRQLSSSNIQLTVSEAFRIDRREPASISTAIERNCIGLGTPAPRDPEEAASPIEFCAKQIQLEARQLVQETRIRNDETLARLEALLESFRYVEGHKVVVFVSEGLALDNEMRGRLRTFGSAAAASSTSFYAVQTYVPPMDAFASGLRPDWDEDRSFRAEGLSFVAGISGGALFRPGAGTERTFDRIARELSARYVLSFTVQPGERDGKPHQIKVRLKDGRSAKVMRHRTEFTLARQPTRQARVPETLAAALSEPLPLMALPLRVGAYAVPEAGANQVRVIVAAEIGVASASARAAFEIFDLDGRRVAHSEDAVAPAETAPLRYTAAIRLTPGQYRLKLAASDGAGRLGSVDHVIDASLGGDLDVATGGLMLFRVRDEEASRPALAFEIGGADRGFDAHLLARASRAAVFADTRAVLDVTDAENGVTRLNRAMALVDGATTEEKSFEARVMTRGWPAGSYVATVTLLRSDRPIGHVSRTITLREPTAPDPAVSEETLAEAAGAGSRRVSRAEAAALVARASQYVSQYSVRAASVVAEERYVQAVVNLPSNGDATGVDAAVVWRDEGAKAPRTPGLKARRQLRSDLLMVRTAAGLYTNYRDVSEVDGKPVKDRDRRALALFTAAPSDAGATLRQVAEEGARYNLGNLRRTINAPTLPLLALHPEHVARFTFEGAGRARVDDIDVTVLRFREQRGPTFIQTGRGSDVFTAGQIWVADDGRVVRTSLNFVERDSGMRVAIDVSYRANAALGLLMPAEMQERYANLPGDPRRLVAGRAEYGNFRRFVVEVSENQR